MSRTTKITPRDTAAFGISKFCETNLGRRDKTKIFRRCMRLQERFINKLPPVKAARATVPETHDARFA